MANTKAFKVKNGLDLGAYSKEIDDTAVDVFVYDTSQDSDGGAWRHRTQATSWYNETLNTSTRGSRKEFPAVAVIVITSAEQTSIMIYDGDDPDLPLWMSFNRVTTNGGYTLAYSTAPTAISALNGIISFGSNLGVGTINFVADNSYRRRSAGGGVAGYYLSGIADRNAGSGFEANNDTSIVDNTINDVAMTVLPNAPIDAATGLPVPTIAVGTQGGTSVIRDDGTVVDITTSNSSYTMTHSVKFKDGGLYNHFGNGSNTAYGYYYVFNTIPTADTQITLNTLTATGQNPDAYGTANSNISARTFSLLNAGDLATVQNEILPTASGGTKGLTMLSGNLGVTAQNEVAFITSDYNTGWMNGNIKLATLSDTDDTDVTGSELVTNGDFSSATGWTVQSGWSIDTGAGTASCDGTNGAFLYQTSGFPANTKLTISFDITSYTSGSVRAGSTGIAPSSSFSSVGSHSVTYTTASNDPQGVEMYSINFVGTIDNVSARIIEEDRSVNGNGLQVFGTVTKNTVATGADLVAYSGWSGSNYLLQPYNSDLAIGTGDYTCIVWMKKDTLGLYNDIFDFSDRSNTNRWEWLINSGGGLYVYIAGNSVVSSNGAFTTGVWNCVAMTRRNGVVTHYINGKSVYSGTAAGIIGNTDCDLYVGVNYNGGNANGELSLLRISQTAASPEQIKKIYEDEKVLFQENAQATLYGSSDAVTALAYDNSTELLHAGTSAGRSVFQGLRRVDNTTTAVSAAISASNNLVGEQ